MRFREVAAVAHTLALLLATTVALPSTLTRVQDLTAIDEADGPGASHDIRELGASRLAVRSLHTRALRPYCRQVQSAQLARGIRRRWLLDLCLPQHKSHMKEKDRKNTYNDMARTTESGKSARSGRATESGQSQVKADSITGAPPEKNTKNGLFWLDPYDESPTLPDTEITSLHDPKTCFYCKSDEEKLMMVAKAARKAARKAEKEAARDEAAHKAARRKQREEEAARESRGKGKLDGQPGSSVRSGMTQSNVGDSSRSKMSGSSDIQMGQPMLNRNYVDASTLVKGNSGAHTTEGKQVSANETEKPKTKVYATVPWDSTGLLTAGPQRTSGRFADRLGLSLHFGKSARPGQDLNQYLMQNRTKSGPLEIQKAKLDHLWASMERERLIIPSSESRRPGIPAARPDHQFLAHPARTQSDLDRNLARTGRLVINWAVPRNPYRR